MLTQSIRLRHILDGKFTVQVLSSPTTTPYHCDLSSQTMQMAVDTALTEVEYYSPNLDEERAWFVELLEEGLEVPDMVRKNPTVHAELALIIAKAKGEINKRGILHRRLETIVHHVQSLYPRLQYGYEGKDRN